MFFLFVCMYTRSVPESFFPSLLLLSNTRKKIKSVIFVYFQLCISHFNGLQSVNHFFYSNVHSCNYQGGKKGKQIKINYWKWKIQTNFEKLRHRSCVYNIPLNNNYLCVSEDTKNSHENTEDVKVFSKCYGRFFHFTQIWPSSHPS